MNNPGQGSEQGIAEQKVRRAAAISALRKIGSIVAVEQQADTDKATMLSWFARYGWIALPGAALLAAYLIVKI
ncbi:MAG TPA: hypothetical protein VMV88_04945 [Gallionella sp.]|nr:hypothetical protein [Gallionella sp.]